MKTSEDITISPSLPLDTPSDTIDATTLMDAILTLMPLDDFVNEAAIGMAVVGDSAAQPPIYDDFRTVLAKHEPNLGFSTL